MMFKCYLHYSDGLTKSLSLTKVEFDQTALVWMDEIDSGQVVYLKIRVIKYDT